MTQEDKIKEIKDIIWPWQHFKSEVTKYKHRLEQYSEQLTLKMTDSKTKKDLKLMYSENIKNVQQLLDRIRKFYRKYEKITEFKKKQDIINIFAIAGGKQILKYKKKIATEFQELRLKMEKNVHTKSIV